MKDFLPVETDGGGCAQTTLWSYSLVITGNFLSLGIHALRLGTRWLIENGVASLKCSEIPDDLSPLCIVEIHLEK